MDFFVLLHCQSKEKEESIISHKCATWIFSFFLSFHKNWYQKICLLPSEKKPKNLGGNTNRGINFLKLQGNCPPSLCVQSLTLIQVKSRVELNEKKNHLKNDINNLKFVHLIQR